MGSILHRTLASPRLTALMNSVVGHYVTIYMIHRPRPTDGAYDGVLPELLENCLVYAKNAGFEFASIDDVVANALAQRKPKQPTLCFTLDDGYQDQLDQLVPVLLKHDCKPTLFAIIDMIDGVDWPWDSKLSYAIWNTPEVHLDFHYNETAFSLDFSHAAARRNARRQLTRFGKSLAAEQLNHFVASLLGLLKFDPNSGPPSAYTPTNWENLRRAEANGLRIGSHACSHRVFAALSDVQVAYELQHANERLASELANPSKVFCYPSGTLTDFSLHHSDLVEQMGFIGALTSEPGNISQRTIRQNPYLVNRHSFPDSFEKFVRYSSWLEYIRSNI